MFVGLLALVGGRLMIEHQLWSLECFPLRAGAKSSQSCILQLILGRLWQFSLLPGVGSLRRLACAHTSHLQYPVGPHRLHIGTGIQSQVAVVLSDAIVSIRYQK